MWGRWRRRARRGDDAVGARAVGPVDAVDQGIPEWASEPLPEPARRLPEHATPVQRTFADYFAAWGLFLPDEAIAAGAGGYLLGKGWSVRWRWLDGTVARDEGAGPGGQTVEFLASHRMTNERWHRIAPDGTLSGIDVPFEAMIFPADADDARRAQIEREYRRAWTEHGEAVARADMNPIQGRGDVPADQTGPDRMTWRLDDGDWQSAPLLATA